MTNPLDELKELEARRAAVIAKISSRTGQKSVIQDEADHFEMSKSAAYRRLCLEFEGVVEGLKDPATVLAMMLHGDIATPERFLKEQEYSNGLQRKIDELDHELETTKAAELAMETELKNWEFFHPPSPVIFSPSDPRAVVGREYEGSFFHDFREKSIGMLNYIHPTSAFIFAMLVKVKPGGKREKTQYFTFIRIPKEGRGE